MKIHPIIAHNPLQNIFYILEYAAGKALIIDPPEVKLAQDFLDAHNLELKKILITHEHYDHYEGVLGLMCDEVYAGEIAAKNMPISISHVFQDGEVVFEIDDIILKAIFTPGHSPGHMMFEMSHNKKVTAIFSGDVLFQGGVGHTRRGGTEELYNSLQKFRIYDDEVIIYSGHDYLQVNSDFLKKYTPENLSEIENILEQKSDALSFTTLGEERKYNPFLTVGKQEFIRLRERRNTF